MFLPYAPYDTGCFDGSLDALDTILGWAETHGMDAYLELHAAKGGQNGFDNGGVAQSVLWTGKGTYEMVHHEGWMSASGPPKPRIPDQPLSQGKWQLDMEGKGGYFLLDDDQSGSDAAVNFEAVNRENLRRTLTVLASITDRYSKHKAVVGLLDVLNEPQGGFPPPTNFSDPLMEWNRQVRTIPSSLSL